jgi:aryl-alcohol dehydrogenase-like predicted oxidoreductase
MQTRQLGKTDMKVSVLGFGAAEIGFEQASPDTVAQLLNDALDAGLNVIDTAECYMQSEELIGQTMAQRRKDYYLFTKCGHPEKPTVADWRPDSLLHTIERSLKRLRTDRVDLVQLHSCSEQDLRKGDVITALKTARDKGWTRYIGYSGDGAAALYASTCGAFDVLQTSVSIADQEAIDLTLPKAQAHGIGVIAKRPIANAAWRYDSAPQNAYHRPYWDRLQKLNYEFLRGDPQGVVSTALRFTLLNVPGVHTAIVGTTKPGRWRENARILEAGPLAREQYDAIRTTWRKTADLKWVGQT